MNHFLPKTIWLLSIFSSICFSAIGQTCTLIISDGANWDNSTDYLCQEGGTSADASVIVIPTGTTVNFNDGGDTWTGTTMVVKGTLNINASGQVTINSSILIRNLGSLYIGNKLNLGSSEGCGYTFIVEDGGYFDIDNGASNRLNICGSNIVKAGGGDCKPYPGSQLPYCEPAGGFPTPLGFDESGSNSYLLPIDLIDFQAVEIEDGVEVSWTTASEVDNDYFTLEKSGNGIDFSIVGVIDGSNSGSYQKDYSLVDGDPYEGISYYRLKQTDFDGSTKTYKPISVLVEYPASKINLFPNPLHSGELNIASKGIAPNSMVNLEIVDLNGAKVFDKNVLMDVSGYKLNVDFLPKGAYFVRLTNEQINENFKIIKK